jgi:hypothetical protein
MHQKSLSVRGDYSDFRVILFLGSLLRIRQKNMENALKEYKRLEVHVYGRSILSNMENMPIVSKLSTSCAYFSTETKTFLDHK